MSRVRVRPCVHSAVEPAAASAEPRRPAGTRQEPAVPVRHLRQRIRHRVVAAHPHGQGKRRSRSLLLPPFSIHLSFTALSFLIHSHPLLIHCSFIFIHCFSFIPYSLLIHSFFFHSSIIPHSFFPIPYSFILHPFSIHSSVIHHSSFFFTRSLFFHSPPIPQSFIIPCSFILHPFLIHLSFTFWLIIITTALELHRNCTGTALEPPWHQAQ